MKLDFSKLVLELNLLVSKFGMKKGPVHINNECFGDSNIVFESKKLRVRMVRDKGVDFIEVSSPNGIPNWIDLHAIKLMISKKNTKEEYVEPFTITNAISFILNYFDDIVNTFSEDRVSETIHEISLIKEKRERLLGL